MGPNRCIQSTACHVGAKPASHINDTTSRGDKTVFLRPGHAPLRSADARRFESASISLVSSEQNSDKVIRNIICALKVGLLDEEAGSDAGMTPLVLLRKTGNCKFKFSPSCELLLLVTRELGDLKIGVRSSEPGCDGRATPYPSRDDGVFF